MKIYLTSAYEEHQWLDLLLGYAKQDRIGRHQLADSPEEADAILFVENAQFYDYSFRTVKRHPLVKRFPGKVYIYNEVDKPFAGLPGLYCSMPSNKFNANRQVAFPYLALPNPFVQYIDNWQVKQDLPFSFVGSVSHKIRKKVLELEPYSEGILDTSEYNVWNATPEETKKQGFRFADAMVRSRFILCPRGIGTSSFRPFEAMQAGRAPVIISDKWVAPPQVDWSFAIKVAEKDIADIPDILETYDSEASDRGHAARKAWEEVYAPDVLFDTAVDAIEGLALKSRTARANRKTLDQILPVQQWLTELEAVTRTTVNAYRQT